LVSLGEPAPETSPRARSTSRGAQNPPVDATLRLVTVLAVCAGVVLRFLPRPDLWLDEALSVNIASLPLGDIPEALRHDGHPPLYYVLLHLWLRLGESDLWVRALSGVIGLAGFPLAYLCGRRLARRRGAEGLGGHRTGLLALVLWALLPYGVRYATETRMYSLVTVLVMAGYLLVDDLLGEPRRADLPRRSPVGSALGLVVVGAALLWSHYWAIWLLVATGVLALAVALRAVDPARRRRGWLCAGALVGAGVLFLPWLSSMLYQSEHTGTPWGEVFRPATILVVTLTDFVGGGFGELQLVSYGLVVAVFVALFGEIRQRVGRQVIELTLAPQTRVLVEVAVLVATMLIGWAASVAASGTYASRYAAVVFPLFVLCVAGGMAMARSPRWTAAMAALVAVALVVGCVLEIRSDRTQAGVAADAIVAALDASGEDPVVVVCPDQLGPATLRALEHRDVDATVVPFPTAGDPRRVDWVDYRDRNQAADPATFAAAVLADAGERPLFLVMNPGYLTFEGKCEALVSLLGAGERPLQQVVAADSDNFFEAMDLWERPSAG
jgi:uncharacterized membrane protein